MQHSQDQLVAQLHAPRVFFLEDAKNGEKSHIGMRRKWFWTTNPKKVVEGIFKQLV